VAQGKIKVGKKVSTIPVEKERELHLKNKNPTEELAENSYWRRRKEGGRPKR